MISHIGWECITLTKGVEFEAQRIQHRFPIGNLKKIVELNIKLFYKTHIGQGGQKLLLCTVSVLFRSH